MITLTKVGTHEWYLHFFAVYISDDFEEAVPAVPISLRKCLVSAKWYITYPTSLVIDEFLELDFGDMSKSESDL